MTFEDITLLEVRVEHFEQTPSFSLLFGLDDFDAAEDFCSKYGLNGSYGQSDPAPGEKGQPSVRWGNQIVPLLEPNLGHPNLRSILFQLRASRIFREAGEADLIAALKIALCRIFCDRQITDSQIHTAVLQFLNVERGFETLEPRLRGH
jgi:hypothetical protein